MASSGWRQLHGYYLTEENAKAALKTRRESAWDRSQLDRGNIDRLPKYRLRSRTAGRGGIIVEGWHVGEGRKFYWIEQQS